MTKKRSPFPIRVVSNPTPAYPSLIDALEAVAPLLAMLSEKGAVLRAQQKQPTSERTAVPKGAVNGR